MLDYYRLIFIRALGRLTIFISRVRALLEADIKKIVALSTLSQLGLIILGLGINSRVISFFHLIAHAFFKALLFICAGILIHSCNDYQDLRIFGKMNFSLPYLKSISIICKIRLCGIPFFSAFYSKEIVLERMFSFSYSNL